MNTNIKNQLVVCEIDYVYSTQVYFNIYDGVLRQFFSILKYRVVAASLKLRLNHNYFFFSQRRFVSVLKICEKITIKDKSANKI